MEKLFEALRDKFPGSEVVDVRFTVLTDEDGTTTSLEDLDWELAEAIRTAEEKDIKDICP